MIPSVAPTRPNAPGIEQQPFQDTLLSILPRPEEVQWEEIPWQTDLWDARRLASQVGKPIFAWMMNGSVLGCT